MDDDQFRRLLAFLGLSWSGYRRVRKGVKRRVQRHMLRLRAASMDQYLGMLEKDSVLKRQCMELMTVSISRFFRDREVWRALKHKVLPDLVKKGSERVRVWSAGCGCGEEVYSFRILWECLKHQGESLPALEMIASDMNPVHLERARAGLYPASSVKEVPEALMARYFDVLEGGNAYAVKPPLKTGNQWLQQDLTLRTAPPPFDLVFLRNSILTYYGPLLKECTLQRVAEALVPGGVMVIGSHEKPPKNAAGLMPSHYHGLLLQRP